MKDAFKSNPKVRNLHKNTLMTYKYFAYGIPIISSVELPAFVEYSDEKNANPIYVSQGKTPETLQTPALEEKPFSTFNENELLYAVPNVARYYVRNGEEIIIESLEGEWSEILLFFYSNCMAAALFQRNLIPFHVSGIFVNENKVLLFAAPSRTGKSTTSVMLQQKGYAPFTDDTAVLSIEDGKCFAQASYPMIRLWQNSITKQTILEENTKQSIRTDIEIDKYGFAFHQQFVSGKVEVVGIVFLEAEGIEIKVERLKTKPTIEHLGNNIYRKQWLIGMKKQVLQFKQLTSIVNAVPTWMASRPKTQPTFETFSDAIEQQIIEPINNYEFADK
jgi:hypothetical protein